ncbi:MAG: pitrilysin family protein [Ancalomicrobiaceae bacterium]|nr:pitrilysin family protein [Ancalomicrobiaceae bacterium]
MIDARFPLAFARRLGQALIPVVLIAGIAAVGAEPAVAATKVQRVISPGGIEAWLVEEHAVPLISMSFAFKGGNAQDPVGKDGTANLLTTLFDEGAGDLDGQTFQAREEDLAMKLSFEQDRDDLFGEFKALSENRDASFDLLALAVEKPKFTDDAVARMKREVIAQVRKETRNPDSLAGAVWASAAFPNHPYGRHGNGTEATITDLSRADVVDYYGRVLARDGLKIGVVGDIDAATLAPLLDKVFGGLPQKARLTPIAEVEPKPGQVEAALDTPQTLIRFGTVGPKRRDADFMPAYLINYILGGGSFSSWLVKEVRVKRGLAYTVDTELVPRDHSGLFIGGLGTRPEKAAESLDIVRSQLKRMAETGPTETELAEAKAYLTGSYALRFDTSGKIATQLMAVQLDDLGIDYFDQRNKLIEAVTLDQVKAAAKDILSHDLTVAIVGPKAGN